MIRASRAGGASRVSGVSGPLGVIRAALVRPRAAGSPIRDSPTRTVPTRAVPIHAAPIHAARNRNTPSRCAANG